MEKIQFKAAIFDLDGTLIDSLEDIADSVNLVLADCGFPTHPLHAYRGFVGNGLEVLIRRTVPPQTSEITIRSCVENFRTVYQNNWNNKTKPYQGIPTTLSGLIEHGVVLAVLSNKPDDFTRMFVKEFFSEFAISPVLGQREGVQPKPHPQAAFEITQRLAVEPQSCAFIGDSGVDMQTGRNAGMFCIGVTWGFRDRQELLDAGAHFIINKPTELIDYVHLSL